MAPKRRLGEILVGCGMIDEFQLRSALSDQKRWGRPLGVTLVRMGFVEEPELLRVLSRQLDTPVVDLQGKRIAPEALALLPVEVVEKYRCIPLFKKREGGIEVLYVGMEDPTDLRAADDLAFRTGLKIRCVLVGPTQLDEATERHYHKLSWEEDPDSEDLLGFETPVEAGDTVPLAPEPPPKARRESAVVGPELLRSEPAADAAAGPAAPAAASPPPPAPEGKPREVPTRLILRAVTQLLVEKGVLGREELMKRVRSMEEAGAAPGTCREEV